jgi:hypothetical protein
MSEATWEPKLVRWSVGPGKTEEDKMNHAVAGIASAIKAHPNFSSQDVQVIATGSYRNRTHIPGESDVDVAVIYKSVFINNWDFVDPRAATDDSVREALMREAGVSPASYSDAEYRQDVENALIARFGRPAVKRGDIAFDVHENTYRVESDCSAAFEYRQWNRSGSAGLYHVPGIRITNDVGRNILNFPEQQHRNGVAKHDRTHQRFKKMVRIVKNLRVEMEEAGVAAAEPIPSFLVESLVYRVPDDRFGWATFYAELRAVLGWLFNNMMPGKDCSKWTEENDIKFLFHPSQKWTQQAAFAFASAAWDYIGFE